MTVCDYHGNAISCVDHYILIYLSACSNLVSHQMHDDTCHHSVILRLYNNKAIMIQNMNGEKKHVYARVGNSRVTPVHVAIIYTPDFVR